MIKKIAITILLILTLSTFGYADTGKSVYDGKYTTVIVKCDGSKITYNSVVILHYDDSWVTFKLRNGKQVTINISSCTSVTFEEE